MSVRSILSPFSNERVNIEKKFFCHTLNRGRADVTEKEKNSFLGGIYFFSFLLLLLRNAGKHTVSIKC